TPTTSITPPSLHDALPISLQMHTKQPSLFASIAFTFAFLLVPAGRASEPWHAAAGPLKTRWAKDVSPKNAHPEYPRPQMVRKDRSEEHTSELQSRVDLLCR